VSGGARPRALVVVDGEHYPPVVRAGLGGLRDRYEVVGGLFAGGREKLRAGGAPGLAAAGETTGGTGRVTMIDDGLAAYLGLPALTLIDPRAGDPAVVAAAVAGAVRASAAEVVVDLSDEPVLGYRERLLLVSAALAAGAAYRGADFAFDPPLRLPLRAMSSLNVIGTGKRVGKTAIAGHLARLLERRHRDQGGVVVVAMGRGGPPRPELVPGREELDVADLLAASRAGRHAASDCFEDAVFARVPTVGCRRCGGGMAGAAFDTNVPAALPIVEVSGAALALFEGSGAVAPPVAADATLCVAGAAQPAEYITGYLGTYRLLMSDLVVLTMCEPPFASADAVRDIVAGIRKVKPGLEVVPTVFRPRPARPVRGRRVAFFNTAPAAAQPALAAALREEHGADVVLTSPDLADRAALADAVARAADEADVFLTEIKAAAIDVVAEAAEAAGRELVFCDNEPRVVDTGASGAAASGAAPARLDDLFASLGDTALSRFRERVHD
jgi:cyclic 2,3-diphosphoglycerate synthetase